MSTKSTFTTTLIFIAFFQTLSFVSHAQAFITQWNLATPGSGPTQLSFGTATSGIATYTWQELSPGSASGSGSWSGSTLTITSLPAGAIIRVQIAPTNFRRIIMGFISDRNRLTQVEQWGSTSWESMESAFSYCENLQVTATDVPDLLGVSSMAGMFEECTNLNSPSNINMWNTAAVTDMSGMFYQASAFNQNIGACNTGAVTNMAGMFMGASAFNQDIGGWNTSAVTSMGSMFYRANAFNNGDSGSINNWNTAAVTDMSFMFYQASAFNQNIGAWNTADVVDMSFMFNEASSFNQNIGTWNTAAVVDMSGMFASAHAFNQNIGAWNTGTVTNMSVMFGSAIAFNQDIGAWNTGAVTNMESMFSSALTFNQNIGSWTMNPGVELSGMLANSGMDCNNYSATLSGWSVNPSTPNGRTLGATGMQYGTNAEAARSNLTTTKGWTITGDSPSGTDCTGSCVPASERAALIALYSATNGSNWINNSNWLNTDESTWHGITVQGCTITEIDLPDNKLIGSIPTDIQNLTSLKKLVLWGNQLSGILPHEIGNLSDLEWLDVSGNELSGVLPVELGNLSNLDLLYVFYNQFSGSIPVQIGNLSNLRYFDFSENQFSGSIPVEIGNLTNLLMLYGINNQLTGTIPTQIGNLINLLGLGLSGNQLTGDIPVQIGNLTKLIWLNLSANQLSGSIPSQIGNLSDLKELILFRNQLTGQIPETIGNLSNLYALSLSENQLTGTIPNSLGTISGLAGINLSDNLLTGALPNNLGNLSALSNLNISNNQFTSIPLFTSNSIFLLYVYENHLNFGHLEANISKGGFLYSPQGNLPGGAVSTSAGQTLTIPFSTPGANNQYQWYKEGIAIAGATSSEYTKANAQSSDAGNYHVEVTNTSVTGLTLTSDPFIVTITPAGPVIDPVPITTQIGSIVTIDLIPLIEVPNGALDLQSLIITIPPSSGATYSISTQGVLTLNYTGVAFSGTEYFTLRACDTDGNCSEAEFEVNVIGEIIIYNALSPDGDGKNESFLIQYIDLIPETQNNTVRIFNRWGDEVWSGKNYNNTTVKFEGLSNNGNELSSGTYFYKLEFSNGKIKTGFISLKQ